VLNLEDEVFDNAFSHLDLAIDEKSEGDEIGIPIVQLCGKSAVSANEPGI